MEFQFQFPPTFSFVLSLKHLAPLVCIVAIVEEAKEINLVAELKGYETSFSFSRKAVFDPDESRKTWTAVNLVVVKISQMIYSVIQDIYLANKLCRPIEKSVIRMMTDSIIAELVPHVSMPYFYAKDLSIYFVLPCRKGYVYKGVLFTDREMVLVSACVLPVSADKALTIPDPKSEYWKVYQKDAIFIHGQNASYHLQAEIVDITRPPSLVASEFEPLLRTYSALKCKNMPALIMKCAEGLFEAESHVKELSSLPSNPHHNGRVAMQRLVEYFYTTDASSKPWKAFESFNYVEIFKDDIEVSEKLLEEERAKRSTDDIIVAACAEQVVSMNKKALRLLEEAKERAKSTRSGTKKQKVDADRVLLVIPPKAGSPKTGSTSPDDSM